MLIHKHKANTLSLLNKKENKFLKGKVKKLWKRKKM